MHENTSFYCFPTFFFLSRKRLFLAKLASRIFVVVGILVSKIKEGTNLSYIIKSISRQEIEESH